MEAARCYGLIVVVAVAAGCDRRDPPSSGRAADSVPITVSGIDDLEGYEDSADPAQTIRLLHKLRNASNYAEMKSLVAPEHREPVGMLVRAVDELIAANAALQRAIRDRIGEGSATAFRRRDQVANILGPLSRDVEVIDQTVSGDSAVVRIQVADRVPLEEVALRRDADVWLVVADDPIPGLADELRQLAAAAHRVRRELNKRPLTIQEVDARLEMWQTPALKRMNDLIARAESSSNPADATD